MSFTESSDGTVNRSAAPNLTGMNEAPSTLTLRDAVPVGKMRDFANMDVLGVQQMGSLLDPGLSQAPMQTIALPILQHDARQLCDVWLTRAPLHSVQFGDIYTRGNEHILFGVIEIDEADHAKSAGGSALRTATDAAYRKIFAALVAANHPHLWRIWNYIPHINDAEAGLERYRQFNIGRQQAFEALQLSSDASPAASALGTHGGKLSIAFLAGRIAPERIENPRQISAYDYPRKYGPRSPIFSRAAMVADAQQRMLFISGTASIIGHETRHIGDVAEQTRESLANIAVLVQQANTSASTAMALADLTYRVYIRDPQHGPLVQQVFNAVVGASTRASYVQADICRADLLVEIEAFASTPH